MKGTAVAVAIALLAVPTLAAAPDPLAGRVAGAPAECIALDRVQGPDIRDDGTIIYRQNRSRLWLTRPVAPCLSLRPPATLIVAVYGSHLCRNDRFRVQRTGSGIPGPICRFGRFVPYDLPRPTARSG
ncbi:hypothetical protein [Sphingomonas rubra]|uniref:Uncharacterized protein n=1 Tax=Sphingomonas rubra TaxID=634430 RepID=A0A1I5U3U6_9SPHN|nr:hypothetical protein [Sphingomonas rubra]SFP89929.1 hypothetical protein SAMN04488241_11088 [Sphingomonas rubra]